MDKGFKRPLKLYLDTSIPNFVFADDDKEKQEITKILFEEMGYKHIEIVSPQEVIDL